MTLLAVETGGENGKQNFAAKITYSDQCRCTWIVDRPLPALDLAIYLEKMSMRTDCPVRTTPQESSIAPRLTPFLPHIGIYFSSRLLVLGVIRKSFNRFIRFYFDTQHPEVPIRLQQFLPFCEAECPRISILYILPSIRQLSNEIYLVQEKLRVTVNMDFPRFSLN
jgi:hypothetical protein